MTFRDGSEAQINVNAGGITKSMSVAGIAVRHSKLQHWASDDLFGAFPVAGAPFVTACVALLSLPAIVICACMLE